MVLGPLGGDDFAMLGWLFGAIVVDRESLAVVLGTSVAEHGVRPYHESGRN